MKRIFLGLVALTTVAIANAQTGTVLVGGNIGISTKNYSSDLPLGLDSSTVKTTSFTINPFVGYQFNDNWTAGVQGAFNSAKSNPEGDNNDEVINTFKVGPFIRYTQPVSDIFSIFGQLEGGYQGLRYKEDGDRIDAADHNGAYAKLFPAVFINVKNGFGLNFDFGGVEFNSLKQKDAKEAAKSFDFTFGKTINIGISKNF